MAEEPSLATPAAIRALGPAAHARYRERREIAHRDHGTNLERHHAALEAVLARPDCRMTDDESLYPGEVVNLAARDPDQKAATALLLIRVLARGDGMSNAEFRWRGHAARYRELDDPWRRPILAAFRHCYEAFGVLDRIGPDRHRSLDKRLPWFPA
ncbi:MAG: hypothetical protein AAFV86_15070 [Pseudomonadota bacterium]